MAGSMGKPGAAALEAILKLIGHFDCVLLMTVISQE